MGINKNCFHLYLYKNNLLIFKYTTKIEYLLIYYYLLIFAIVAQMLYN